MTARVWMGVDILTRADNDGWWMKSRPRMYVNGDAHLAVSDGISRSMGGLRAVHWLKKESLGC